MFCWHDIDWTAAAAWAQAILSGLAILAAMWLQNRDRNLRSKDRALSRYMAVLAIAENCVRTLNRLDSRVRDGEFTMANFGYYRDETKANLVTVAAIDLSQIDDPELSAEIMKLRRLMQTARRRLRLGKAKLRDDKAISKDRFNSLHKQAIRVVGRMKMLQTSKAKT